MERFGAGLGRWVEVGGLGYLVYQLGFCVKLPREKIDGVRERRGRSAVNSTVLSIMIRYLHMGAIGGQVSKIPRSFDAWNPILQHGRPDEQYSESSLHKLGVLQVVERLFIAASHIYRRRTSIILDERLFFDSVLGLKTLEVIRKSIVWKRDTSTQSLSLNHGARHLKSCRIPNSLKEIGCLEFQELLHPWDNHIQSVRSKTDKPVALLRLQ